MKPKHKYVFSSLAILCLAVIFTKRDIGYMPVIYEWRQQKTDLKAYQVGNCSQR